MNEREAQRMSQARRRLLAVDPFYGWPSMYLQMREAKVGTMCTDGTHLDYDPAYTSQHSLAELMFDIAHETSHNMLLHPFRIGGRDHRLANEAGDYVINEIIDDGKLGDLAQGLLRDARFNGLGMERVYAILWEERQPQQSEDQPQPQPEGQDQPGGEGFPGAPGEDESEDDSDSSGGDADDDEPGEDESGEPSEGEGDEPGDEPGEDEDLTEGGTRTYFKPAPQPEAPSNDDEPEAIEGQESAAQKPMTADDWKQIAEQAVMVARKAGNLPGGADIAVEQAREPGVDWKTALRDFVEQMIPSAYDWTSPDRRFIQGGVYLPGVVKENTPAIDIAVDTSGSTRALLAQFGAEVSAIFSEVRPERVRVIYCDAEVHRVDTFGPDDEITFEPVGGGGTSFVPVFEWVARQDDEMPAALVFLTDLEGHAGDEPDYPVLWVAPESSYRQAPFGELVHMPVGVSY